MTINYADKGVLGLSAKSIMAETHMSSSAYGLIASGFFFLFSVSAAVVGVIIDRWPTKWVLLAMALIWSIMQLPMLGTVGFATIFASRVVLGAAEGPALPVANHAAYKWFGTADRSMVGAILTLGAPLGSIAAPAITLVIVNYGWHAAFGIVGLAGFVWAAVWLVAGREGPETHPAPVDAQMTDNAEAVPADASIRRRPEAVRLPYRRIVTSGTWLAGLAASFAAYWSVSLLVAWLPNYLEKGLGYSVSTTGTLVVLPWIVGAISMLGQGLLTRWLMNRGISSRWSRGVLGGGIVFVSGLALFAFIHSPDGWGKIALMAIGFNVAGLIFGIAQSTTAEITPVGQRGTVLGVYTALYATAGVIAPYLTGRLVDAAARPVDGFNISFTIAAVLMMVTGVAAALFMRPEYDANRLAAHLR
jgi:MFS family permease